MNVNMQNPKVKDADMMTCGRSRIGTVTLSEDFPGDRGHSSMTIIFDHPDDMRALAAKLEKVADQLEACNTENAA